MNGLGIGTAGRTARVAVGFVPSLVLGFVLAASLTVGVLNPWGPSLGPDQPLWLVALTVLTGLVVLAAGSRVTLGAAAVAAAPASRAARAARLRAERSGAPRQVHPDAEGHVRSRAPGQGLRARPV